MERGGEEIGGEGGSHAWLHPSEWALLAQASLPPVLSHRSPESSGFPLRMPLLE